MKPVIQSLKVGSRVRVINVIADNSSVIGVEATIGKIDRGSHDQYKCCYRIDFGQHFIFGPFLLDYAWVRPYQIELI